MKDKVYVLIEYLGYDDFEVIGAFKNLSDAERSASKYCPAAIYESVINEFNTSRISYKKGDSNEWESII